jgi:hypothetical protein
MESPCSGVSLDNASSSSADSSSADSSLVQAFPTMSENPDPATVATTTVLDNDDSASDISMSEDSDDGEEEGTIEVNISSVQANLVLHESNTTTSPDISSAQVSKKRKFGATYRSPNGQIHNEHMQEVRKRFKPDHVLQTHWTPEGHLRQDKSLLPPEIWHHIFTFCPPKVLGNLLQVNKSFNAYLDPSSPGNPIDSLSISSAQILSPDAIWRASKRLFLLPGMPVPIAGKSELDMWKLACGSSCQFCGKKRPTTPAIPSDQWHAGPGENGVVSVWSFGIRTCGSCLQKESLKVLFIFITTHISLIGLLGN